MDKWGGIHKLTIDNVRLEYKTATRLGKHKDNTAIRLSKHEMKGNIFVIIILCDCVMFRIKNFVTFFPKGQNLFTFASLLFSDFIIVLSYYFHICKLFTN